MNRTRPVFPVDSQPFECLRCNRKLTGASNVTGLKGQPTSVFEALEVMDGAANVCIFCSSIAFFVIDRGNIKLRYPRADERLELAQNEIVQTVVKAVRWRWLVALMTGRADFDGT